MDRTRDMGFLFGGEGQDSSQILDAFDKYAGLYMFADVWQYVKDQAVYTWRESK